MLTDISPVALLATSLIALDKIKAKPIHQDDAPALVMAYNTAPYRLQAQSNNTLPSWPVLRIQMEQKCTQK